MSLSLHCRRLGRGPRDALAVHCSLAHGEAFAPLAAHLPMLSLHAPDLPGHGRSPGMPEGQDYHRAATAALRALPEAEGSLLIGHSLGATLALRMALERESPPETLVLIEPVLFAAAAATAPELLQSEHADAVRIGRAFEAGETEAVAREFTARWGDGRPWESLPREARARFTAQIPLIAATDPALRLDNGNLLAPGRLEGLTSRVLLIRGSESPPIVAAIHAALLARLPQARERVVEGAGHMAPVTHAAEVAEAIASELALIA
ncbi:alpha/beta fold hydrolase [Litorisediminicola beolgyonensis]|uniref:Alpha/beta fold hydrolase n=1 Tax=Litorisediminicola beolgyonensis TaxID=1173614 RepID=A0ABW3ZM18_9RHOB